MARKGKLTPELQEKICKLIEDGNYDVVACQMVGITDSTFYEWLSKGEKFTSGRYVEFRDAIKEARAKCEANCLKHIKEDDSWTSKAWILERRFPDRWARKDKVSLAGHDGQELKITVKYE